ncbi:MAG: hypothetical protein Kow0063_11180 [Anaerolineae bacterium]
MARDAGLAFVFLTDRNAVSGLPEMDAATDETLLPAGIEGAHTWTLTPDEADWVTVEFRDKSGAMLAVTNPIFL